MYILAVTLANNFLSHELKTSLSNSSIWLNFHYFFHGTHCKTKLFEVFSLSPLFLIAAYNSSPSSPFQNFKYAVLFRLTFRSLRQCTSPSLQVFPSFLHFLRDVTTVYHPQAAYPMMFPSSCSQSACPY